MSQTWSSSPGATPPSTAPPRFAAGPPAPPAPTLPPRRQENPGAPPPGGGQPPSGPDRSPSPDARNALIIAAAVVVVVLLFALSFTWVVDRTSADEAAPATVPSTVAPTAPPSSPPSSAPTTPPTTAPPPPEPDTIVIRELQDFVGAQRGLAFTEDVPVALLSDEEFEAQLLALFPPGSLEAMLWELQILGLAGTGPDAIEELQALLVDSYIGLYANGRIIVKGEERTPELDTTIVHEMTHALDDQNFGFDRPELADTLDESPFGFEAVIEGSAMNVEEAYAQSKGLNYVSPSEGELSDGLLALPKYIFGEDYVQSLLDSGGNARLNEAFATPPKTSKEIMESAYHLSGYSPTPVDPPPPPDDAEIIDEGLFGQVRFWQMFTQVLAPGEALELASTWTGDWHIVWVDGLEQCVRVDAAVATPEAASVFAETLRTWAVSQDSAIVEELSSGLVRLTVCAPRPPPPPGSTSPA